MGGSAEIGSHVLKIVNGIRVSLKSSSLYFEFVLTRLVNILSTLDLTPGHHSPPHQHLTKIYTVPNSFPTLVRVYVGENKIFLLP